MRDVEKIEYETPKNGDDIKGMYQAVSSVLIGMGRPSSELGYLSRLYNGAVFYEQAKKLGAVMEFKD